MRYFSRGWATGDLDEAESDRAREEYVRRREAIWPRLSEPARQLARNLALHDALIDRVRWRPATKELTITLITLLGNSEYLTATLTYVGALLGERSLDTLRAVARDRETVVLYHEVDLDENQDDDSVLLVHRLLFWPRDELVIYFRELGLHVAPRADSRVDLGGAFIEQHEEDDDETD